MLAVSFRMAKTPDALGQAAAFGIACAATLIIFTIARGHYYMLLLPATVFATLWLQREDRPRWAIFVAIAPLVLVLAHYTMLNITGRIGLLGLGTTAWYFATCTVLLMSPRKSAVVAGARTHELDASPDVEHALAA
jgi:hypothetical protein